MNDQTRLGAEDARDGGTRTAAEGPIWSAFARAAGNRERAEAWLALQCRQIEAVATAVLLLRQGDDSYAPVAVWPDRQQDARGLGEVVEQALVERRGTVRHPGGARAAPPVRVQIAYPLEIEGRIEAVAALELDARPAKELQLALRRLHWGIGWIESLLWRDEALDDRKRVERSAVALDLLAVVEQHERLEGSAMALVDEIAASLDCARVSIGFRRRGVVRVRAISHSAWFQKRSNLVRLLENAMDEAVDQGATVVLPAPDAGPRRIDAAHRDLAEATAHGAVATVPLPSRTGLIGALTLERKSGTAFDPDTLAICEAAAALLGPVLGLQLRSRRWLSGRAVDMPHDFLARLVGPRRLALKLSVAGAVLAAAYLATATSDFRVSARAELEGAVQRAAVAPFDGFIAEAPVRAGERVAEGELLALLDDRDLALERLRWASELDSLVQEHKEALARHDRGEMGVLAARAEQARAQLALAEDRISRARIVAPIDGVVVSGDLSQMLGSPVEQGDLLFELAPLDAFRVALRVDEHDIRHVRAGQEGRLALTGLGGATLPFTVKRLTSVAEAEDGINAFRVEARLDADHPLLRPGMEGVGKIHVEDRPTIWVWTRGLMEWLRLTLWRLSP